MIFQISLCATLAHHDQLSMLQDVRPQINSSQATGKATLSCVVFRAVESEDASETEALLSAAEQGQAGPGKFFYFSTFVQAALIVHELRLLDLASVRQVGSTVLICRAFAKMAAIVHKL